MSGVNTFPKFISNAPSGTDQLSSKSQQKIAISIAEHIRSNGTDFKLIGLDGEWGAGKSNVIKILDKELGDTFYTFIYDAWSHQEDLQRRSFLEELTDELQNNEVIDPKKWKEELKNLLAKKKNTVTKTIPKLSYGIIVSLLLALFIPVSSAVAEVVEPHWIKIPIAAFPLIAGLVVWAILLLKDFDKYKKLENLFYLYKEKDLKQEVDETISEDEPSVRDFRNWMHKLSSDIRKNKNLLIVFDNMDRLPADKVQSFWASIHTFFSEKHYDRIWVIVPFDRKHIQQAFMESGETFEKTNHFINKTFSVIYNVAPVVLTDWKEFFDTKFAEAFGDTEKPDQKTTRYIFDRHTDIITPRKIIAFINDLIALKMIWKKEIDLRYMALYVLNKESLLKSPLSQILNSYSLRKAQSVFNGDDTVIDNLAALLYNVPLDEARQLTLLRETELAIRKRRFEELLKLAEHPDFFLILEQIQADDMEIEEITEATEKLEAHFGDKKDADIFSMTWDKIITKQLSTQIQNQQLTPVLKTLIVKASAYKRKLLVSYLLNQFRAVSGFAGDKYYQVLNELESILEENKIAFDIPSLVEPRNVSSAELISYLKAAGTNYKRYKITYSDSQLEEYFMKDFPSMLKDGHTLALLDHPFPRLIERIEKAIKENSVTLQNLENIFTTYKALSGNVVLKEKLPDSIIQNLLQSATKDTPEYYELIAMRMGRTKDFTNYGGITDEVTRMTEPGLVKQVAQRIGYYNTYGVLLTHIVEWNVGLLKEVLREITLNSDKTHHHVATTQVLTNFVKIATTLAITNEQLMTALDQWNSYFSVHINSKTLQTLLTDPKLLGVAIAVKNNLANTLLNATVDLVNQASDNHWKVAFSNDNDYLFQALVYMLKGANINSLNSAAFAAYKQTLLTVSEGTRPTPRNFDDWNVIYGAAEKMHLVATIKDIRDFFRNKIVTVEQFLFFEKPLREIGHLSDFSGDVIRKILKPVITNKSCAKLIANNHEFYVPVIIDAGEDAFDLIETIRKTISSQGEEAGLTELERSIEGQLAPFIKINSAVYYSSESNKKEHSKDVTEDLRRSVAEQKLLFFKVTNEFFNHDPHHGVRKILDVKYLYKDRQMSKSANESEWFSLP